MALNLQVLLAKGVHFMINHKFIISVLTLGFLIFSYSAFAKPGPHGVGPHGGPKFNRGPSHHGGGFNKPHGGFNKPGFNKPGPVGGPGVGPNHKPGMGGPGISANKDFKADQNHDGILDKKELHQGKIVKYDNNDNGVLDPAEKKYMHTDKNHDGKVGPVEKKFAENHQPTPEQHQNFVEQADTDDNGFVSPSEKGEFIKDQKSQVTNKWENNIDTNYGDGDGIVSGEELKAFKAEHPDFKIPGKHPHKKPHLNPIDGSEIETGAGAVLDTEEVSE